MKIEHEEMRGAAVELLVRMIGVLRSYGQDLEEFRTLVDKGSALMRTRAYELGVDYDENVAMVVALCEAASGHQELEELYAEVKRTGDLDEALVWQIAGSMQMCARLFAYIDYTLLDEAMAQLS